MRGFPYRWRICWRARVAVSTLGRDRMTDLIKYMLSKSVLISRIGRWILTLSEFSLTYVLAKAVKGQVDFLADHSCVEVNEPMTDLIVLPRWTLYFDGSKTADST